ncbi:MAG: DUF4160 domain-containing protein [Rickettsiales bacterium]|nr:DUF4160 domain-containing protein [Rickettsiales bacterium]
MPEISRFFGIVIYMYFNEHNPPHFHVKYNDHRAQIDIETLGIIDGSLPPKVLALVVEWASIHQNELRRNWLDILENGSYEKINPLE